MSLDAAWARRWIELAAADVAEQRDYLVDLDRAIGDGDHGENMDRGFKAAGDGELDAAGVAAIIEGALGGIQARGKATTGEKTMVDAWTPALDAARAAAESGADAVATLQAAATAAEAGAAATEPLRATKGRASYLGERSIGHLDPGAVSTSLILRAAARAAGEVGAA